MRIVKALSLLLVLAAPLEAQRELAERLAVDSDASIRIVNLMGSVRVLGWARDSIVVTGSVEESGRFYFAGGGRGAKLGVESRTNMAGAPRAHLEVRVPARARVWIKTESATIDVNDVRNVDLYAVGGRIRVGGALQQVYAESMDGAIEVTGIAVWVRTKTATGAITVSGVRGDVAATTVSGTIDVRGGPFERVRMESVTGDLRLDGRLDRGGSFDLESHSGAIVLVLGDTLDAEFDITSFQGVITNDLTAATPTRAADGRRATLSFMTGEGGADVSIRTFKGTVQLWRR